MKIIKKAFEEPTKEELQIIEDLQSLKHEKVCEIDLMDLVSRYVVKEHGLDQNVAIKLDPDKMTATIYEVSEKNDGKKRATKQAKKEEYNIEIKQFSDKTCGVLSDGQLVAVVSYVKGALQEKGLLEDLLKKLMEELLQERKKMVA